MREMDTETETDMNKNKNTHAYLVPRGHCGQTHSETSSVLHHVIGAAVLERFREIRNGSGVTSTA